MEKMYLTNGQEVVVIATIPEGFIVRTVVEDEGSGEMYLDETEHPFIVKNVFKTPPVERWHKEILELEDTINRKKAEIFNLQSIMAELNQTRQDKIDAMLKSPNFNDYLNIITGKATHFVLSDYGAKHFIMTAQELFEGSSMVKFISFTNASKIEGEALTVYIKDSIRNVVPATSYDDALARLQQLLNLPVNPWNWTDIAGKIKTAEKYGLTVPLEQTTYYEAQNDKCKKARIADAEMELKRAKEAE